MISRNTLKELLTEARIGSVKCQQELLNDICQYSKSKEEDVSKQASSSMLIGNLELPLVFSILFISNRGAIHQQVLLHNRYLRLQGLPKLPLPT